MNDPDPIDLSLPAWRDDPTLLQAELTARLKGSVVIDADLPRPTDTLTVQLLLAAQRAAKQAGQAFEIRNPSEAFIGGLKTLGLAGELLGQEV